MRICYLKEDDKNNVMQQNTDSRVCVAPDGIGWP